MEGGIGMGKLWLLSTVVLMRERAKEEVKP